MPGEVTVTAIGARRGPDNNSDTEASLLKFDEPSEGELRVSSEIASSSPSYTNRGDFNIVRTSESNDLSIKYELGGDHSVRPWRPHAEDEAEGVPEVGKIF